MEAKVQKKLLEIVGGFIGQTLKHAAFKKYEIKRKNILVLELIFSDESDWKTMVLALDKDLTEGDYKEIAEKLIK